MGKQQIMTAAEYARMYKKMPGVILVPTKKSGVKKGRPSANEVPMMDSIEKGDGWCEITLAGIMPGLNELLREHYMVRKKRQDAIIVRLKKLAPPVFSGPVIVTMTGYSSVLSDWENFACKFKLCGDSFVDMGILKDDKPAIIRKFLPDQIKCRRKDACLKIKIQAVI